MELILSRTSVHLLREAECHVPPHLLKASHGSVTFFDLPAQQANVTWQARHHPHQPDNGQRKEGDNWRPHERQSTRARRLLHAFGAGQDNEPGVVPRGAPGVQASRRCMCGRYTARPHETTTAPARSHRPECHDHGICTSSCAILILSETHDRSTHTQKKKKNETTTKTKSDSDTRDPVPRGKTHTQDDMEPSSAPWRRWKNYGNGKERMLHSCLNKQERFQR